MRLISICLGTAFMLAGCVTPVGVPLGDGVADRLAASPPVLPAIGATAVYRVINGYNAETLGEVSYRVDHAGGDWVLVAVISNSPFAGTSHMEEYTAEGNWLRHPILNHDYPTDYQFAPPYPAYPFPLDIGKSWSSRVNATNPANGRIKGMLVNGTVAGGERVSTPAGTFDTLKIVRYVYSGDFEVFVSQTVTTETDWYAPALGRPVRVERRSYWYDPGLSGRRFEAVRGDWRVYELVRYAPAAP